MLIEELFSTKRLPGIWIPHLSTGSVTLVPHLALRKSLRSNPCQIQMHLRLNTTVYDFIFFARLLHKKKFNSRKIRR